MTNTPLSHSDSISPLPPLKYSLQRRIMLILSGVLISLILLISPLSHELRPAMLDDLGLQPTLNWLIDRQKARPIS